METQTIEMRVVDIKDLTNEQKIRSLEREIRWYKKELAKMQLWLNSTENKDRHNYSDVLRRSRDMQYELRDKEDSIDILKQL